MDIVTLKSLNSPPPGVAEVMQAVAVLLGRNENLEWKEIRKQLFSNISGLMKDLRDYDKDNISLETIQKIQRYV